jgi:hypothetical protein|tara:strand:- start:185 stop:439 length:255 start_codon:yes stop_codon:yes gene_type:complete
MCMGGGSNNPVLAEDYYSGYIAEDGTRVAGLKQNYGPLPSLSMGDDAEPREGGMKDVPNEGSSYGTGRTGQKRRTFFTQYGTGS